MRQYRGLTKDGKWVYGNLIWNNGMPFIVGEVVESCDEYISFEFWWPVIPETVGQQTGLTDSNRTEIYEGDRVKSTRKHGQKTLNGRLPRKNSALRRMHGKTRVVFDDGGFFIKKSSKRGLRFPLNSLANQFLQLEVIGNAHSEEKK